MKPRFYILGFLIISGTFLLSSCSSQRSVSAMPKAATFQNSNLTAHKLSQIIHSDYLLFLPKDCRATGTNRWPVLLFLHGIGQSGTDVWQTAVSGPAKYIENHPEFPFIFISPQCPKGHKWSDEAVLAVLDEVIAKYPADTNRIYLTGLSQGGFGVWSLLTTYPDRFAAAAPISGGGDVMGFIVAKWNPERTEPLRRLPVWVFHGSKDPVVPISEDERMVAALKKFGNTRVRMTIYPEGKHDVWTETYANPELYRWFLEHSLAGGAAH